MMGYIGYAVGIAQVVPSQPSPESPPPASPAPILIDGHHPSTLLFRVYDHRSASPLESDGFTATSAEFKPDGQNLSGSKWRATYNKFYYSRAFRTSDRTRETIIKHVLGGWPGYTGRGFTGPSNWISATESFDWAVWEVARRLVVLKRGVVGLALLDQHIYCSPAYKGNRCVVEHADEAIEAYGDDYWLDPDQTAALNFSRASSEVVFLGRIFNKDIVDATQWTEQEPAYPCLQPFMEGFFKPTKHWSRSGDTWLDWLVFNPREPFSKAMVKIEERRDQLERSRRGSRR